MDQISYVGAGKAERGPPLINSRPDRTQATSGFKSVAPGHSESSLGGGGGGGRDSRSLDHLSLEHHQRLLRVPEVEG